MLQAEELPATITNRTRSSTERLLTLPVGKHALLGI